MVSRAIEQIKEQIEAEGYEPGTEAFEQRFLVLKISKCQELHGVTTCGTCSYQDECAMKRQFAELRRNDG